MAGLQRFITYIYRYENDEKKENAGFAKIEIRGSICRMEVHIRNLSIRQTECTVYLFARNENIMHGIPVGTIAVARGNGDVRYAFDTKELLKFGVAIENMEGILIPSEEGNYLASQWKEGEIAYSRFQILEKRTAEKPSEETSKTRQDSSAWHEKQAASGKEAPPQNQTVPAREAPSQNQAMRQKENPSRNQAAQQQENPSPRQAMSGKEAPSQNPLMWQQENPFGNQTVQQQTDPSQNRTSQQQTDPSQNQDGARQPIRATELPLDVFFEEAGWEGIFGKFRLKSDLFFPFEGHEVECVRLQLKDLQEFPRKYWYFGKNSFLLHGFFNYRHIIFGEMTENKQKKYILGVPGVFTNQERIMASMFGFPEFCTAKATEYKTGNFGYWYRVI